MEPLDRDSGDNEPPPGFGTRCTAHQTLALPLPVQHHLTAVHHHLYPRRMLRHEGNVIRDTGKLAHLRPGWALGGAPQFEFALAIIEQQSFFILITAPLPVP